MKKLTILSILTLISVVHSPAAHADERVVSLMDEFYQVFSARFSADGKSVLAILGDGELRRIFLDSAGKPTTTTNAKVSHNPKTYSFLSGDKILIGTRENTVVVWDSTSGRLNTIFAGKNDGAPSDVHLSRDGKRLLLNHFAHTELWDLEVGEKIRSYIMATKIKAWCGGPCAWSSGFSPDDSKILLGGYGDEVEIWDANDSNLLSTYKADKNRQHTNAVMSLEYSPDGKKLLITDDDGAATTLDAMTGEVFWNSIPIDTGMTQAEAHFFSDSNRAAVAPQQGSVQIWDTRKKEKIREFPDCKVHFRETLALSSDEKTISAQCQVGKRGVVIQAWDVESGEILGTFPIQEPTQALSTAFSPIENKLLIATDGGKLQTWSIR